MHCIYRLACSGLSFSDWPLTCTVFINWHVQVYLYQTDHLHALCLQIGMFRSSFSDWPLTCTVFIDWHVQVYLSQTDHWFKMMGSIWYWPNMEFGNDPICMSLSFMEHESQWWQYKLLFSKTHHALQTNCIMCVENSRQGCLFFEHFFS